MQFRQMKYFVTVSECGSFSQASEVLNIAQPALSRQIKDLEDSIAVDLFRRLPRGVELTPAGESLLRDAKVLMQMLEMSRQRASLLANSTEKVEVIRGLLSDPLLLHSYEVDKSALDERILYLFRSSSEFDKLTLTGFIDFYVTLRNNTKHSQLICQELKREGASLLVRETKSENSPKKILFLQPEVWSGTQEAMASLGEVFEDASLDCSANNFFDMYSELNQSRDVGAVFPDSLIANPLFATGTWKRIPLRTEFVHYLNFSRLNENVIFSNFLRKLPRPIDAKQV